MLNYFRINDPYRLIAVMVLLILIRIPYYIWGDVVSEADIRHFMLGEKVASGLWLYQDFYTSESLLSALSFGFVNLLFGKSIVAFHILAYLLAVIQVFLFNKLVTDNHATINQTYYPGLFYALFLSVFPESFTLSPFLIGQTLLLIALNYQFNHLEFRVKRDEKIILIGILLGLYSLLVGAASLFLMTAILIFAVYTSTLTRRYFLMITGFFIPWFLSWGIFEITGYGDVFAKSLPGLLDGSWDLPENYLYFTAIPALFFLMFLPSSLLGRRFTNYQSRLNFSFLIWALFSVAVYWISSQPAEVSFILLAPILGLYGSHYFISKRRPLAFTILFVGLVFGNVIHWRLPSWTSSLLGQKEVVDNRYENLTDGKSLLVLDSGFNFYRLADRHASKFFDWKLSNECFSGPLDYFKINEVYLAIKNDPPEVIIDPNDVLSRFFERLPEIEEMYKREGDVWLKISS